MSTTAPAAAGAPREVVLPATHRDGRFGRLWAGAGSANVADGILTVGATLLAAGLASSATGVAGIRVAGTLPWLLFALPLGALVDRMDRRRVLVTSAWLRVVPLLAVAGLAATDRLSLVALYVLVLACATAEVAFDSSSQATVPMVVPRDRLPTANGRIVATQLVGDSLVGNALAGLVAATAALTVFLGPAVLYVAAGALALSLPGSYRAQAPGPGTLRADVVEGVRFLARQPFLLHISLQAAVLNLAFTAYMSVFVLFVVGPGSALGLPPLGYSLLVASLAVGGAVGGLAGGWVERTVGRSASLIGGLAVAGLLVLVPVVTTDLAAIAAALLVEGFGISIANVAIHTLRQRITPARLLGRVLAAGRALAMGAMPVGALVGGVVADLVSLRAVFAGAGALVLTMVAIAARHFTPAALARAEAATSADERAGAADGATDAG